MPCTKSSKRYHGKCVCMGRERYTGEGTEGTGERVQGREYRGESTGERVERVQGIGYRG